MPVAVTERVKLPPVATVVETCGWIEMAGAVTPPPLLLLDEEDELEDELELLLDDDDELLELDELLDPDKLTVASPLVTEPPVFDTTTEYTPTLALVMPFTE